MNKAQSNYEHQKKMREKMRKRLEKRYIKAFMKGSFDEVVKIEFLLKHV